jgi:3-methylcrotonyl-CoA carboxylase alpha subunit
VSLFERDCSVQRRHQKVLEEAPAPGMSIERREAMGKAAVEAARAVGYVGAGTVEFIANQDGSFYFMEMNTRLQVEHPVTEMITGVDLVEWQCRVANGERVPKLQHELQLHGHAIEARIYAENPEKGFLPSIGQLIHLRTPAACAFTNESSVRIDSGVSEGDVITPHYDPMIAKLIVWGEDRAQALTRMSAALAEFEVVGPSTNIAFLGRLVASQPFSTADLDTGLIERHHDELFPAPPIPTLTAFSLAGVMLTLDERAVSTDPWSLPTGWRMNSELTRAVQFGDASGEHALTLTYQQDSLVFSLANANYAVTDIQRDGAHLRCNANGKKISAHVIRVDELFHVFYEGHHWQLLWRDPIAHAGEHEAEAGRLTAPMPGKIVSVLVAPDVVVEQGTPLLIMEAMKMEHTISAPSKGSIAELLYVVGDQVAEGAQLLTFIHQEKA